MYDPMTLIYGCRFFDLWHVDPEKDGTDDSCDWFNRGKAEDKADPRRLTVYEALWDMETLLDNRPHYPDSPEHKAFQPLKEAIRLALAPPPRWIHPRWHVWHWKLNIHAVLNLKRWLFSRCAKCGGRFPWRYAPVTNSWYGTGPRWFRGESHVFHHECCVPPGTAAGAVGSGR